MALLRALRPDLKIEPLRVNLDTRLRKLDEGQYDAIVLAAAGLKRLKLEARIRDIFEPEVLLPAAGQGALGIEVRNDGAEITAAVTHLIHQPTWLAVAAERAVSRAMGGSCSMPLAAYATLQGDVLTINAAWGDTQNKLPLVRACETGPVTDQTSAAALGQRVAEALMAGVLAQGGSLEHLDKAEVLGA